MSDLNETAEQLRQALAKRSATIIRIQRLKIRMAEVQAELEMLLKSLRDEERPVADTMRALIQPDRLHDGEDRYSERDPHEEGGIGA